jgi:hypothetical protein
VTGVQSCALQIYLVRSSGVSWKLLCLEATFPNNHFQQVSLAGVYVWFLAWKSLVVLNALQEDMLAQALLLSLEMWEITCLLS